MLLFSECADFIVEILRVSIHQILWARKLYPRAIFKMHKQFSVSVQVAVLQSSVINNFLLTYLHILQKSIHPEVNKYIDGILSTVQTLLLEDFIDKFVVVLKKDKPIENFVFSLDSFYKKSQRYLYSA